MSSDTDKMLADIYKEQQDYFDNEIKPLLEQMAQDTDSTEMVDDAKEQREHIAKITPEIQSRNNSRFMGEMTAAQQHSIARMNDTVNATTGTSMVNNARANQKTSNLALRGNLASAYDSLLQGSTSGLSQISQNEHARQAQYEANKGSFGSTVLGAVGAVAGGVIGGPAGAAIGGSLGSTVGGYI